MIEGIQYLLDWFATGIYDFVTEAVAYWVQASVKASLYLTYQTMLFSWDVAKVILQDLRITDYFAEAFNHFDSQTLDIVLFFRIPEFFSNVTTAYIARFAFGFISKYIPLL